MKIISVVGARPNFIKVAPIHKSFQKRNFNNRVNANSTNVGQIQHLICHTGQHYDENMSKVFFGDLELPKPDFYLGIGSGTHAEQTGKIMIEFEKVLLEEKPDLVIVFGDVNSTIACSLVAAKLGIKIAHVEAGLRSFDKTMPEEINRILTDRISDYLFVTEKSGIENLKKEGVSDNKIFFVGNVMIDSLFYYLPKCEKSDILKKFGLINSTPKEFNAQVSLYSVPDNYEDKPESFLHANETVPYILVTLHRPSNVDSREFLERLAILLNSLGEKNKVIFPLHPRTRNNMNTWNIEATISDNVILTDPVGYLDFISLIKNSKLIITDSGGIQEETTALGIKCITIRENTERPVTVEVGTNILAGTDLDRVGEVALHILNGNNKDGELPELWDGKAGDRIVDILVNELN